MKAKEYEFDYWDGDPRYGYGGYKVHRWPLEGGSRSADRDLRPEERLKVLDVGCGKAFLLHEMKKILPGRAGRRLRYSKHGIAGAPRQSGPICSVIVRRTPIPLAI